MRAICRSLVNSGQTIGTNGGVTCTQRDGSASARADSRRAQRGHGRVARFCAALFFLAMAPLPARATILQNWSLEDVVDRSHLIVVGTVGESRYVEIAGQMYTETDIDIERVWHGPPLSRVTVTQLGGRDGDIVTEVVGTVPLVTGQRVLLLLRRARNDRHVIAGMSLGAYLLAGPTARQNIRAHLFDRAGRILPPPGARSVFIEEVERIVRRRKK